MPWNRSAASSATHRAAAIAQQQLRSGRTVSASPLVGRKSVLPHRQSRQGGLAFGFGQTTGLEGPSSSAGDVTGFVGLGRGSDEQDLPPESLNQAGRAKWEMLGAGTPADNQTGAESQSMHSKLDHESGNFLEFVGTAITQRNAALPETAEEHQDITFAALLPPAENTRVVAAQAMLHILNLATCDMLNVAQEDSYGAIQLKPIMPPRAEEEAED